MTALKIDFSAYAGMSLQSEYMRSLPVCSFVQFATIFLQKNPRAKSRLSLKSALMNFIRFQDEYKESYNTDEIGKELLDDFARYLHVNRKLKINTVKGLIQRMKYFLKKAQMNGWAVDNSYTDVRIRNEDLFFIYLSERDIARIYYFEGLTKREKELRDLFILGCMTGQRFSDYSHITINNIVGDNIRMLTQKTKAKVCVPITKYVKEIFAKYNNCLPKACCIQHFNKVIKDICRKTGMTEMITYEREVAGEIKTVMAPKYRLITSHTARRTFITNMIKNNIQESKIMGRTGHKSRECMNRYNQMTLEENARSLAGNGFLA